MLELKTLSLRASGFGAWALRFLGLRAELFGTTLGLWYDSRVKVFVFSV